MVRERQKLESCGGEDEELYFEMDFSHNKDDSECDTRGESIGLFADHHHDKPALDKCESPNFSKICRGRSNSIPIHPRRMTWGSPKVLSTYSLASHSLADTPPPVLSISPTSSYITRKLRQSFSKLLHRGSFSRSKSPDHEEFEYSDSEYNIPENRRTSECSIISPSTEEVVNESIKNGLPLIPFAYPTFFIVSKKQEDVKKGIRKNSVKRMERSFSEGRNIDSYEADFPEEKEDKSLQGIIKIAKEQISKDNCIDLSTENEFHGIPKSTVRQHKDNEEKQIPRHTSTSRKQSQSSYVEMNLENKEPGLAFSDTDGIQNKRKNNLFDSENCYDADNNQHCLGRNFRKGNRHKNDYVFLDFEKKKDYVDMAPAKQRKWQFLDLNKRQ